MSTTAKTWVRRPTERRTELLDAAEALFAARGFATTTVADITEAAGVSKGSFYVYFQSKDELVEALNDRFGDALLAVVDAALTTEAPPVELLKTAVERTIHALFDHRQLIEVWRREPGAIGSITKWMPPFTERLPGDSLTTALLVAHGIFGTVLQAIVLDEKVDVDALVSTAQEFAVRAFGLDT